MAHAEHHGHHITPLKTLTKVILALAALTILTVITAEIDLGPLHSLHVPLALTIAGAKAYLVVSIFMGLKYDNKVNTLVLTIGIMFVVVFLVFTLFDTAFRGDLDNQAAGPIIDPVIQAEH